MTSAPTTSPLTRLLLGDLVVALLMGVVGAGWLAWLQAVNGAQALTLAGLLTMIGFTLPAVLFAVPVTLIALRRDPATVRLSPSMTALVCAPVAAAAISSGNQLHLVLFDRAPLAGGGLPVITLTGDALSLLAALLPMAVVALVVRDRHRLRQVRGRHTGVRISGSRRARGGLALAVGIATAMSTASLVPSAAVGAPSASTATCLGSGPANKTFDVTALDVDIPINRFGDHDTLGKMYALTSRVAAVRGQEASQKVSIGLRDDAIQPLVIRANEGDCVEITFHNKANGGDFGMHIDGLEFNASSSGDAIGANDSSAASSGQSKTYRYSIPKDARLEGGHYIHPGPGYRGAVDHGLFGSLVVEPAGSTYWNASAPAQPLASGWEAIIKPMGVNATCVTTSKVPTCAFREGALLHHEIGNDNELLKDKNGADTRPRAATVPAPSP